MVSLAATAEDGGNLSLNLLNQRTLPSILSITVRDHNGKTRKGSGFFVDKNGQFVTNFRLIENASRITVRTQEGWLYKVDEVIALSPENDLALLRAPVASSRPLDLSNTNAVITTGDTALAVGSANGIRPRSSNGVVAAVAKAAGKTPRIIEFTAPATTGDRGGPLVNQYGRVIGVIRPDTAATSESASHQAVHVSHLRELMTQTTTLPLSVTWTNKPKPAPPPPLIAQKPQQAAEVEEEQLDKTGETETPVLTGETETAPIPEQPGASEDAVIAGRIKLAGRAETSPVRLTEIPAAPRPPEMRQAHHIGQVRQVVWLPVLGQTEPGLICPPMISHYLERELGIRTVTERADAHATLSMGGRIDTGEECNMWGCFDGYRLFMNFEISNYRGKPLFRDYFEVDEDDVREACEELAEDIVDELEDLLD